MDNKQIIKEFKYSFNAYLKGFTSGRFGQDKDTYFDCRVALANELATEYTQLVKEDWECARQKAVANILFDEKELRKIELMFGKQSQIYTDIYTKLRIAEFVCNSLPYLKED